MEVSTEAGIPHVCIYSVNETQQFVLEVGRSFKEKLISLWDCQKERESSVCVSVRSFKSSRKRMAN